MSVQGDSRWARVSMFTGFRFNGMLLAHWFNQHEQSGFPVPKAALGSCDLSVLHIGSNCEWLVRQAGRDVAEWAARSTVDAKRDAGNVALKLG